MIVTWRIGLRIALIMIVAIVLQVSFFSYLTLFGTCLLYTSDAAANREV